jgi:hypothetical protein
MPIGLKGNSDGSGAVQIGGSDAISISTGLNTTFAGTITATGTVAGTTGTLYPLVSGTAVSATGTSIDFTGIPSWARRITVMFYSVSTNGTSNPLIQIGSGSFVTSNYSSASSTTTTVVSSVSTGAGFIVGGGAASNLRSGILVLSNLTGNTWVSSHALSFGEQAGTIYGGGLSNPLSGALDRVRITTVNGTDTFDAGTINLLWE